MNANTFAGDGGQATSAKTTVINGLYVETTGNIYLADSCKYF